MSTSLGALILVPVRTDYVFQVWRANLNRCTGKIEKDQYLVIESGFAFVELLRIDGELMSLPINELEDQFVSALERTNRVIIEAPTGSGKSTQIPQFLLAAGLLENGEAIVLQPRRIAARMLAKRVAYELGESVGGSIGFQIRHETMVSTRTKVRFVTEGILLRRMIGDPELRGVDCIVFDEFHERSIHADLSLARALMIQKTSRPDLKIIVMSATLDSDALQSYLGNCELVRSEGRTFPVSIRYIDTRTANSKTPIWEIAASETLKAVEEVREGHVLIFMPGAFEIGRTISALGARLSARDFELMPLHGELSTKDQDRALEKSSRRKVIVSTNVAETSLTIDNARVVIDSGQARVARYDPARGINTLWIEKISDASAKQRSGRAGRTAEGLCVRLWTAKDHGSREAFDEPEMARVDLAETLLTLKATGIDSLDLFPWFERPDESRLGVAIELLRELGAIDEKGAMTPRGKRMSSFPLHPRYAAMLLAAKDYECVDEICVAAALSQSRNLLLRKVDKRVVQRRADVVGEVDGSDVIALMRIWSGAVTSKFDRRYCDDIGVHANTARQVNKVANQLYQYAQAEGLVGPDALPADEAMVRKCLLIGFPDRVCKRLDRGTMRCDMADGKRGNLSKESLAKHAELFVAFEANEIGRQSGEVNTVLNLCSQIEREWLEELYPNSFSSGEETVFDEKQKRVVFRKFARYQKLNVEMRESLDVPLEHAATVLAGLIVAGKAKLDKWDESVETLIVRVNLIAAYFPEYEIDPIGPEARGLILEECCHGARSLRDLKKQEVLGSIKNWVGPETMSLLDTELPLQIQMPNGRRAKIRYREGELPVISAKIQEFYDFESGYGFCGGKLKPMFEMLAPNSRPVQLTHDLDSFWTQSYPGIKKELKGRYPKHDWR
ncbi:ATP-dependent helicase HrpB [Puniceicoccaceae bacterium K14]|nr:ATP-dependent helicase HrpB [Puniceicoccaceae bacterium K14]